MLDHETNQQVVILRVKVRQLESKLETAERAIKDNNQLIQRLNQKLQETSEFSLKVANQMSTMDSVLTNCEARVADLENRLS